MSLFLNKETIAENLGMFIRLKGYSKSSFAKKVNISRPTLDQLLEGQSPNETAFLKQLEKIAQAFQLSKASFLSPPQFEQTYATRSLQFSDHLAHTKERTPHNQKLLEDLEDLLDIATLYL